MSEFDLRAVEERTDALWEQLLRSVEWGHSGVALRTARQLDAELRAIPAEYPGSVARPGIVGMLQFAVVSAAKGDLDEAIAWRMKRIELLEEFLAADPENSLALYSHEDLQMDMEELAQLRHVKHEASRTGIPPGPTLPCTRQHV